MKNSLITHNLLLNDLSIISLGRPSKFFGTPAIRFLRQHQLEHFHGASLNFWDALRVQDDVLNAGGLHGGSLAPLERSSLSLWAWLELSMHGNWVTVRSAWNALTLAYACPSPVPGEGFKLFPLSERQRDRRDERQGEGVPGQSPSSNPHPLEPESFSNHPTPKKGQPNRLPFPQTLEPSRL